MIGDFGVNAGYVEELHARYRESPQNVDPEWRQFFEAAERGPAVEVRGNNGTNGTAHTEKAPSGNGTNGTYGLPNRTFPPEANRRSSEGGVSTEKVLEAGLMQGRVYQLLNAYRVRGHLFAALDPLGQPEESREPAPELDLENFGLREADLDVVFPAVGIGGLGDTATLRQIITHLEETYCRSIGVEFTQIEDPEMRGWLQARMESTANHARLYFDLPSTVGASGPRKVVRFETAESTVQVRLGIFPDRDGADETYALTLAVSGADDRTEIVPVSVHDQDRNLPLVSRILVDFTDDETGFFRDPRARGVVQQAADDWSYFLDDMALDAIPPMDEQTLIWRQDGFVSEKAVRNPNGYSGFLLYAYGIHSDAVRSGGEGSYNGKAQTHTGAVQPLRRSGGLEVETQGNFNTLGWIMDTEPERWWVTANLGREQNDLYSIVHHEMGHAHGFNPAYPLFATARETGLRSPALAAYHGGPLRIDVHDHFDKTVDPDSGFGAFGNEYHGVMPARRWLITRLDLLALEAVGYKVRLPTFEIWRDTVPDCP